MLAKLQQCAYEVLFYCITTNAKTGSNICLGDFVKSGHDKHAAALRRQAVYFSTEAL